MLKAGALVACIEIDPQHGVDEKAVGQQATIPFIELINTGPLQMEAWRKRNENQYGRKLRVLVQGGCLLVGATLISEGVAKTLTRLASLVVLTSDPLAYPVRPIVRAPPTEYT